MLGGLIRHVLVFRMCPYAFSKVFFVGLRATMRGE